MDQEKTVAAVADLPVSIELKKLLKAVTRFILRNSYVQFNGKIYHQIDGMPMGTNAAVELANLFGDRFIDNNPSVLEALRVNSVLYKRFIDDLLVIWTGGLAALNDFHALMNAIDPKIKFTMASSNKSIPFLDLLISIKGNRIDITTYQKSMNKYLYLPFTSAHPMAAKRGFIKGELIRYARNSSTAAAFGKSRTLFRYRLQARGYPSTFLDDCFATVDYRERSKYLIDQKIEETNHPTGKPVKRAFFKVRFSRFTNGLRIGNLLRAHLSRINGDPSMHSTISPVVCFTRGQNIADRLTSSRFAPPVNQLKRRREIESPYL
jgi:hypothetical protein